MKTDDLRGLRDGPDWKLALGMVLMIGGLMATSINPTKGDLKNVSAISGKALLMGLTAAQPGVSAQYWQESGSAIPVHR